MAVSNPQLWESLEAYEFDQPDSSFPFSARLARENGWTKAYADRVIDEYRRFLYLAATSDVPMTPSDEVDQAWHLHLAYSRDYWERLCKTVLKGPLHHGPTLGGAAEAEKYRDCYDRTKARYAAEFDVEAPSDIWPATEIRFDRSRIYRRIDTSGVWLIPAFPVSRVLALSVMVALALVSFTAYSAAADEWKFVMDALAEYPFFEIILGAAILYVPINWAWGKALRVISKDKNPAKREPGGCSGAGCGASGCGGCGGCGS